MLIIFVSAICAHKLLFVVAANWCIGKSQTPRCRCPQSSQPKGIQGAKAGTKRQKVATPPPPPVFPIPVESSPSSPEVQAQQAPSPQPTQEAPQMEEPQQEGLQTEGISADVGEQTTGPASPVISSAVSSIQTTVVPLPGNISQQYSYR